VRLDDLICGYGPVCPVGDRSPDTAGGQLRRAVRCDLQSFMSPILGRYVAQYRRDVPVYVGQQSVV